VGVAFSHDHWYLPDRDNRGWKPLPQSKTVILPPLTFLGSKEVSSSIKLAAFQASSWADTSSIYFLPKLSDLFYILSFTGGDKPHKRSNKGKSSL